MVRLQYQKYCGHEGVLEFIGLEVRLIPTYVGIVYGITRRAFGKLKCDVWILYFDLFFTYVEYDRAFLSSRFLLT